MLSSATAKPGQMREGVALAVRLAELDPNVRARRGRAVIGLPFRAGSV